MDGIALREKHEVVTSASDYLLWRHPFSYHWKLLLTFRQIKTFHVRRKAAPGDSNADKSCSTERPKTGCCQRGATSCNGNNTKARPTMRGCGNSGGPLSMRPS